MRTSSLSLTLLATTASVLAATVPRANPKVLHSVIQRLPTSSSSSSPRRLLNRGNNGTLEAEWTTDGSAYFANITIGTPGQDFSVVVDTGSSDLWVPSSLAAICDEGYCTSGSYDSGNSSSFESTDDQFSITYGDNSYATGVYFNDTMTIGSQRVTSLTMGLGISTDNTQGVMGIGLAALESDPSSYKNLPLVLVNSDVIMTPAYSLWLNDKETKEGALLFGGVDTSKYSGDFKRISIIPGSDGTYAYLNVNLTSLVASSSSGDDTLTSGSFPITVLLDSGTSLTYLPDDLVSQVWSEVGAVNDTDTTNISNLDAGTPLIPCSQKSSNGSFTFRFASSDGPAISVPMSELVVEIASNAKFISGDHKGKSACQFGIWSTSDPSSYILGDTFLRSAFVTYDLANLQIGLAQTVWDNTASNIVEFEKYKSTIPGSTFVESDTESSSTNTSGSFSAQSGFQSSDDSSSAAYSTVFAGLSMPFAVCMAIFASLM